MKQLIEIRPNISFLYYGKLETAIEDLVLKWLREDCHGGELEALECGVITGREDISGEWPEGYMVYTPCHCEEKSLEEALEEIETAYKEEKAIKYLESLGYTVTLDEN